MPGGRAGIDDYDDNVVACGVNSAGADAVFKFNVQTPRRVRIDTEGSSFKTVISLHDGPPPQAFIETASPATDAIPGYASARCRNDTVSDTAYAERSDAAGTTPLPDSVAPMCGATATTTRTTRTTASA